jgi:hypothetical protein
MIQPRLKGNKWLRNPKMQIQNASQDKNHRI